MKFKLFSHAHAWYRSFSGPVPFYWICAVSDRKQIRDWEWKWLGRSYKVRWARKCLEKSYFHEMFRNVIIDSHFSISIFPSHFHSPPFKYPFNVLNTQTPGVSVASSYYPYEIKEWTGWHSRIKSSRTTVSFNWYTYVCTTYKIYDINDMYSFIYVELIYSNVCWYLNFVFHTKNFILTVFMHQLIGIKLFCVWCGFVFIVARPLDILFSCCCCSWAHYILPI